MLVRTYSEYHLGDQLIHLNYLRKVCQENPDVECIHYCKQEYLPQLLPLCENLPITLQDLQHKGDAVNSWIGADGYFYHSPLKRNWVAFHLDWFSYLSNQLDVLNPMQNPDTFLFDYPELAKKKYPHYDYLVINSVPMSGQLPDYQPWWFIKLVNKYKDLGYCVITTLPTGACESTLELNMSVTDIGALSKSCKSIVAVDTGPLWTTYNIWNKETHRTVYGTTSDVLPLNTITKQSLI